MAAVSPVKEGDKPAVSKSVVELGPGRGRGQAERSSGDPNQWVRLVKGGDSGR